MKTVTIERRYFVTTGNSGNPTDSEFHWLLRHLGFEGSDEDLARVNSIELTTKKDDIKIPWEGEDNFRICDKCGKIFSAGYYDFGNYYCSKDCLPHTEEEWRKEVDENPDECYYTEW